MKSTTKFNVKDLVVIGEWDESNKLMLITEIGGNLRIEGKFKGFAVDVRGAVEAGSDNQVRLKVHSIGNLPNFLIPGILHMVKKFSGQFAIAASVEKDAILINPNRLIPEVSGIGVLIQPQKLEITETAVVSLRERILAWTEQNAGSTAKETVDIILALPDVFALLVDLAKDPQVPRELKLKIGLCIAYVIAPVDLIPELIVGPLGLVADAVALGLILSSLVSEIPAEVIREHWQGRADVLELILPGHAWTGMMSKLPEGVLRKLVALFGGAKSDATVV